MSYEPNQQDIQFIRDLIASPKNIWGIPRSGNPDDPQTYTTYFIDRDSKTFFRLICGPNDTNDDHGTTAKILTQIGWRMSEHEEIEPNLGRAIDALAMDMILKKAAAPEVINDLVGKLRGNIFWKPMAAPEPGALCWQCKWGDWNFGLVKFDIGNQPGRKPGDKGCNISMSNMAAGLIMVSDSAIFHDIAKYLVMKQEIRESVKEATGLDFGVGKTEAPMQAVQQKYGPKKSQEPPSNP